jgi:hypothetical protein
MTFGVKCQMAPLEVDKCCARTCTDAEESGTRTAHFSPLVLKTTAPAGIKAGGMCPRRIQEAVRSEKGENIGAHPWPGRPGTNPLR